MYCIVCTPYKLGWVNMFVTSQLIYVLKSRNKQIFAHPWKIHKQNLNYVHIFLHCAVTKLLQDRESFLSVRFLLLRSSKQQFTLSLFLNYCTSKILIFTVIENVPKMPKDIKNIKIKGIYETSNIKLGFKSFQAFQKNYFINLIFPKFGTLLYCIVYNVYVSAGQNTIRT